MIGIVESKNISFSPTIKTLKATSNLHHEELPLSRVPVQWKVRHGTHHENIFPLLMKMSYLLRRDHRGRRAVAMRCGLRSAAWPAGGLQRSVIRPGLGVHVTRKRQGLANQRHVTDMGRNGHRRHPQGGSGWRCRVWTCQEEKSKQSGHINARAVKVGLFMFTFRPRKHRSSLAESGGAGDRRTLEVDKKRQGKRQKNTRLLFTVSKPSRLSIPQLSKKYHDRAPCVENPGIGFIRLRPTPGGYDPGLVPPAPVAPPPPPSFPTPLEGPEPLFAYGIDPDFPWICW